MPHPYELFLRLVVAVALTGGIGLERELQRKGAGLRTNALVGLGAALAMIVSQYGFTQVVSAGTVVLDPSRVAAQIVSGIGFLGAGLIFVRRDAVRGLTTAATVWLSAMVGMACGADLLILAVLASALGVGLVLALEWTERAVIRSKRIDQVVQVAREDAPEVLARMLGALRAGGLTVRQVAIRRDPFASGVVTDSLILQGLADVSVAVRILGAVRGVSQVQASDADEDL